MSSRTKHLVSRIGSQYPLRKLSSLKQLLVKRLLYKSNKTCPTTSMTTPRTSMASSGGKGAFLPMAPLHNLDPPRRLAHLTSKTPAEITLPQISEGEIEILLAVVVAPKPGEMITAVIEIMRNGTTTTRSEDAIDRIDTKVSTTILATEMQARACSIDLYRPALPCYRSHAPRAPLICHS